MFLHDLSKRLLVTKLSIFSGREPGKWVDARATINLGRQKGLETCRWKNRREITSDFGRFRASRGGKYDFGHIHTARAPHSLFVSINSLLEPPTFSPQAAGYRVQCQHSPASSASPHLFLFSKDGSTAWSLSRRRRHSVPRRDLWWNLTLHPLTPTRTI